MRRRGLEAGGDLTTKIDNFIKDIKRKRRTLSEDARFPKTDVFGKLEGHSSQDILDTWNDLK
jgi:hypothetical protein